MCLCAALVWILQTGRWTVEAWTVPTEYSGDALEMLARIKACSEGDLVPLGAQRVARLGAPLGADWSGYPMPERIQVYGLGLIARVTGVHVASNLGLLASFALAALAFYGAVRRWLRVAAPWAVAGALLFAYNTSINQRGLSHFSFVMIWVVPLGLPACWLVARAAPIRRWSAEFWWCMAAGAMLGMHNTYYLFFWLQLVGWAMVAQWFRMRRWENIATGGAAIMVAMAAFVVVNGDYWQAGPADKAMPLLHRNYGGTERYALKPLEMFVPPANHRASFMAFLGQRYGRWSEWRGEEFLPYLGVAGIGALLWLSLATLPRLFRGRRLPGAALSVGWLTAFATVGGLTNLLAFFAGFFLFRATNRIVIFIAAVLLVFLVVRLSRATASWPRGVRILAAAVLVAVGLLDQLPRPAHDAQVREVEEKVCSDEEFARCLERELGAGAMVFQLPVLGFPEVAPVWRLGDYEHFRPYLATHTLRFSYGVPKFRPRARWQSELEGLAAPEMARALESYGFAGLYFNRRAFEDRGESLLRALQAAGFTRVWQSPLGTQVVVGLHPAAVPRPPVAQSLTPGRGWNTRRLEGVRWTHAPALLLYYNPHAGRRPARVELELELPSAQRVRLLRGKRELGSSELPAGRVRFVVPELVMEPGFNSFRIEGGKPLRSEGTQGSLRMLGLCSSHVQLAPP